MSLDPSKVLSPQRVFRSLERKVLAPLVVVFLAIAALTVVAMVVVYRAHRSWRAVEEARMVARSIARLRIDQQDELNRYVAALSDEVPVHLVVVVAGKPPMVVASTRDDWVGRPLSDIQQEGIGENIEHVISTGQDADAEYPAVGAREYTTPYGSDGAALVHVDAVVASRDVWVSTVQQCAIALGGIAGFGIIAGILLRRRVTRRISALSSGVDQDLPLLGVDAIGARRFDDEITHLAGRIEESRARERRIDAELERLALVARKTSNAVIVTDTERRILWVNEGFTRITGYTLDEVVGLVPGHVLQSSGTSAETVRSMRAALDRREACRVEILNRAKDGRDLWLDVEILPMRDAAGVCTGFVSIESDLTAAVRAREEIAASERRQKLIVASAELGTWDWNLATGEISFNERWCRMLGYEPSEIEPHVRSWERVLHPDDRERVTRELQAHFTGKSDFYRCEHRLRHKDGSVVWVHDAGKVYERDATGKPLRMAGVHLDITERRRAEERFELAVRGSSAGIWDWDVATNANFMSVRFKEMLGYSADEAMDSFDGWANLLHPDDREWVLAALWSHVRSGTPYSVDYRLKHRSGSYRWYHAHGQAVWDEQGKPVRMAGSLEDIHERRVLEHTRARLAAIVEGSEDSILGVGLDGNIASVNAAAARMFGVGQDALIGRNELEQVPEQFRAHEQDALVRIARGERVEQYESRRVRGDGSSIEVSVSVSPVLDEQGRVVAASKIVRDISERSEKRELEKLNALLGTQNRKLEEMTDRAHRFVDDVSHEFRTPLTVIREYSSIIAEGLGGPVSAQQAEWLQIVDVATVDLNQMVEDFLDSSKLRAGRLRVDRRACTVISIVAGVRRMVARKAASRKIFVVEDLAADLPLVFVDEEKVRRVIMNLVSNAIKFSPDGGKIVLSARTLPTGDVDFAVKDEGPGLASADMALLFERFRQLPNALAPSVKGFGLGLNIARQLVWLNLGKISVASEPKKGATFSFTLPAMNRELIVERFFDRLAEREEPPASVAILRITPVGEDGREHLRRIAVATTRPSDIVLEANDGHSLVLFGPTGCAQTWRTRVVDGLAKHAEQQPAGADVTIIGTWSYPAGTADARAAIRTCVLLEDHQESPEEHLVS